MKNGLVIADSVPIFSLALVDKLNLLNSLFDNIKIPQAVWDEISSHDSNPFHQRICHYFNDKVEQIKGINDLTFIMDYGESQSVILYKELKADFLLIDDKKSRSFAENFGIHCIGIIGLLSISKDKVLIGSLKPIFDEFMRNKRYYLVDLLNAVLTQKGESKINFTI